MMENKGNGKDSQALKLSGSFSKTSDKRKSTDYPGKQTSAEFSWLCFELDNLLMSLLVLLFSITSWLFYLR